MPSQKDCAISRTSDTFKAIRECGSNGCDKSGGGNGSGSGGSKPKQVNGQSQRTADGGVIMVTPEGKEWVWNGKYNTVATYEHNGVVGEYHSVMQGDPDARWRKVNGKNMQESDPRYTAEADAAVKKQGPVTVHDHRTPQPTSAPPASGTATKFGTAKGAASGQALSTTNPGSTTTNTGGSYVRDHRAGAKGTTVPPPIVASGIDKRPGRNAQ